METLTKSGISKKVRGQVAKGIRKGLIKRPKGWKTYLAAIRSQIQRSLTRWNNLT